MAVVYVFQEEGSNYFKIGRSKHDATCARQRLRAGNPRPLALFREIETHDSSECEGMFHRLLGNKRVRLGGGTEFFEVESGEMADQIERIGKIFSQLQAARGTVRPLATTRSSGAARRPEPKDLKLRQRLVELKQERGALDLQIELLELKLKQRIGAAEGIEGVATWKTQDRRCFNEQVFRDRRPALYEEDAGAISLSGSCGVEEGGPGGVQGDPDDLLPAQFGEGLSAAPIRSN